MLFYTFMSSPEAAASTWVFRPAQRLFIRSEVVSSSLTSGVHALAQDYEREIDNYLIEEEFFTEDGMFNEDLVVRLPERPRNYKPPKPADPNAIFQPVRSPHDFPNGQPNPAMP
jgi:hypothetical protein